ncbi:hypothetical protein [Bordetella sp. LUAb4]|uniref:hypothetical protein n=1 Tax=Bordetella sp. LUAb4 TaxID=2843195 RepID=UPI001E4DAB71|nr:hypothetical protein [Bordetella sp. LUAb4]
MKTLLPAARPRALSVARPSLTKIAPSKLSRARSMMAFAVLGATWLSATPTAAADGPKTAEPATKQANAALEKELPFSDKTSFEPLATRREYPIC